MDITNYNFGLGNRALTAEESAVADKAKALLRRSLERHGRQYASQVLFQEKLKPSQPAVTKRPERSGTDGGVARTSPRDNRGSASWQTSKVASAIRKY